jgi:glycine cleavage system aminomethyltransferase T
MLLGWHGHVPMPVGSSPTAHGHAYMPMPHNLCIHDAALAPALTPLPPTHTLAPTMLKRTPFHDFHVSAGGRMVDFAGWEMPILYRGITEEHQHTRNSGSLFDVSHMGRLSFSGPQAMALLDRVLTRKISDQKVGQSRYSLICNGAGGIIDDVIASRDQKNWLVVCNSSNRDRVVKHFNEVRRARCR